MKSWEEMLKNQETEEEKVIVKCIQAMHDNAHKDIGSSGPGHIYNVMCVKAGIKIEGDSKSETMKEVKGLTELAEEIGEARVDDLKEAGFDAIEKIVDATDEDLLAVDGIGEVTLDKINNFFSK